MTRKEVQKIFRKLTGDYNYGAHFSTSSEWIKENDPGVYETLLDMLEEFTADETNRCDENDLSSFKNGNWEVEYIFMVTDQDELEISITAGRDGQHIANQPAWFVENVSADDIVCGFVTPPLEKYVEMIE